MAGSMPAGLSPSPGVCSGESHLCSAPVSCADWAVLHTDSPVLPGSLQQVRGGSHCFQPRADWLALQQGTEVHTVDGFVQDLPLPGLRHRDLGTPAQLPTALQISDPNPAILPHLGKSQKTRDPSGVSVGGKSINSGLKLVRNNLPKTTQQVFDKAKPDGVFFWYEGPQRGRLLYPRPYFCPQHMHALDTRPRMLQPYSPYRTELLSMSHVLSIFQPLSRMLKTAPFLEPPCWEQQKTHSFMWSASSGERKRGRYFTNPAFRFYSF